MQPLGLEYNGEKISVQKLADMIGRSSATVHKRIKDGWTVENIIDEYCNQKEIVDLRPFGKFLQIVFLEPIYSVFASMQPRLGKAYTAELHCLPDKFGHTRQFAVVNLENGKPLIVYPGEFQILGAYQEEAACCG